MNKIILLIITLLFCGCHDTRDRSNISRNYDDSKIIFKYGKHSISIICKNEDEYYEVSNAKSHTLDELKKLRISSNELKEILKSEIFNQITIVTDYSTWKIENEKFITVNFDGLHYNQIDENITSLIKNTRNGDVEIWESYTQGKSSGMKRINR